MIRLRLPQPLAPRRLPFFLALEEWAADSLSPADEYFFSWQPAGPTIICGRNQSMPLEVDLPRCRELGIDVVRRRSGGGAVVSDGNNVMLSYLSGRGTGSVSEIFARWSAILADALRHMGLPAEATGRNDICIRGRKVSGGAFYAKPRMAIAHSTMILRLPSPELVSALTPSRAKLETKGVRSVQARISSLHDEGIDLAPEEFADRLAAIICDSDSDRTLTPAQVLEVEKIEKEYYDPRFLRADERPGALHRLRTPRTGEIAAEYGLTPDGRISSVRFLGDFMPSGDLDRLCAALRGLTPAEIPSKAPQLDPGKYIEGLDAETLRELFSQEP